MIPQRSVNFKFGGLFIVYYEVAYGQKTSWLVDRKNYQKGAFAPKIGHYVLCGRLYRLISFYRVSHSYNLFLWMAFCLGYCCLARNIVFCSQSMDNSPSLHARSFCRAMAVWSFKDRWHAAGPFLG